MNPRRLRTYIYAKDANLMCKFFEFKDEETAELWEKQRKAILLSLPMAHLSLKALIHSFALLAYKLALC
jgi:hypothetical protein